MKKNHKKCIGRKSYSDGLFCSEFLKLESLVWKTLGSPKLYVIFCINVIYSLLIRFSKGYITQKRLITTNLVQMRDPNPRVGATCQLHHRPVTSTAAEPNS